MGARGGDQKNRSGKYWTHLHGRLKRSPLLLSHGPRRCKRPRTQGQGCGPWAKGCLPSCPLTLCSLLRTPCERLLRTPGPQRPTNLPVTRSSVSSGGSSLRREAAPVAKGWDHPAPWGRSFRRNLPKVCTGLPHTPALGSSRPTRGFPSLAWATSEGGKVSAL